MKLSDLHLLLTNQWQDEGGEKAETPNRNQLESLSFLKLDRALLD